MTLLNMLKFMFTLVTLGVMLYSKLVKV